MKQLFLISFCIILYNFAKSQPVISPSQNNEYCPDFGYTFTATIPKTYQSMIGVGGCYVTQLPTPPVGGTFTFKGKFGDANQKQSFRINYTDGTSYDFEFKRIKSLFYGACTSIQSNLTTITAPPCQVTNHNISFNNLQWKTEFESPALCFGSITTYEYLLPSGWILNGTTSNGSIWIAGDNNETVTSSLATGGAIQIRAVNSCGASLTKGSPVSIAINRPKPPLTFTAPQFVCNSSTFTAGNVPAWVNSFTWQMTPSTLVNIIQGNPATFTKINNGLGDVKLTIGSSGCGSYEYQTFEIIGTHQLTIGTVAATGISGFSPSIGVSPGEVLDLQAWEGYQPTYNWNISGGTIVGNSTGQQITVVVDNPCNGFIEHGYFNASVSYTNPCGTGSLYGSNCYIVCSTGGPMFAVFHNPASENVTIDGRKKNKNIKEIRIIDKLGNVKKVIKYSGEQKLINFSISTIPSDIYYIQIFDGKVWESKKISVTR